jgi:hypothetical protein
MLVISLKVEIRGDLEKHLVVTKVRACRKLCYVKALEQILDKHRTFLHKTETLEVRARLVKVFSRVMHARVEIGNHFSNEYSIGLEPSLHVVEERVESHVVILKAFKS